MKTATDRLTQILDQLRAAGIHTTLRHDREGAISIDATVPGERWEIDLLDNGEVEVEVFRSDGTIFGESKLAELLERFSD